jgi:CheY-like chemotaxis protein
LARWRTSNSLPFVEDNNFFPWGRQAAIPRGFPVERILTLPPIEKLSERNCVSATSRAPGAVSRCALSGVAFLRFCQTTGRTADWIIEVISLVTLGGIQGVAKFFAIWSGKFHSLAMTQPLALVLYERLLPGSQLVNRLQDLKYRVQTVTDPQTLVACVQQEKPMLVLIDLASNHRDLFTVISQLKKQSETQHVPVIAFASEDSADLQNQATEAGATLVASDTALLNHLPQFLDQALQVE